MSTEADPSRSRGDGCATAVAVICDGAAEAASGMVRAVPAAAGRGVTDFPGDGINAKHRVCQIADAIVAAVAC